MKETAKTSQMYFLKFIAFFAVFCWHAKVYIPAVLINNGYGAAEAVSFFFIYSGFMTCYNFRKSDGEKVTVKKTAEYVFNKLKKFYPLYIFLMVFAFIFSNIPHYLITRNVNGLIEQAVRFICSALFLQSWISDTSFSFLQVGWFYSTIMLAYIMTPLLKKLLYDYTDGEKQNYKKLAVAGSVVIVILVIYCYLTRNGNQEYYQYTFPPARLGEYILGMMLGKVMFKLKNSDIIQPSVIAFSIFEIVAVLMWYGFRYLPVVFWHYRILHWLIPNCLLLCVFSFGNGLLSQLFSLKPFVTLGKISGNAFLIHAIVLGIYGFLGVPGDDRIMKVFSFGFCLIITLMWSYLVRQDNQFKL